MLPFYKIFLQPKYVCLTCLCESKTIEKETKRNEKGKKNEIALLFSLVEFKIYKYITLDLVLACPWRNLY